MLDRCDILCLQETWLGPHDHHALDVFFPNHITFYNGLEVHRGGTLIMVSAKYAKNFKITVVDLEEEVTIPTPDSDDEGSEEEVESVTCPTQGRVQALHFSSLLYPNDNLADFNLANVYLPASGTNSEKIALLEALDVLPPRRLFLVGDFNFIDDLADSSKTNANVIRGEARVRWHAFLVRHNLNEVVQETHTYYRFTDDIRNNHSSRLDRIYTSCSQAEWDALRPAAHLPYAGPSPSRALFDKLRSKLSIKATYKALSVSDHIPIALTFTGRPKSGTKNFNAPRWLGEKMETAKKIQGRWEGYQGKSDPFEAIDMWKKAVKVVVKTHFEEIKAHADQVRDCYPMITAATSLYNECILARQNKTRIESIIARQPSLADTIKLADGRYMDNGIAKLLDDLFLKSFQEEITPQQDERSRMEDELPPSYTPGGGAVGTDPISKIKSRLPSSRERLTHLRATEEDEPSSDPKTMGGITKGYYSEVWKRDIDAKSYEECLEEISDVEPIIPPNQDLRAPDLDMFIDVIHETNNSCAGPDGIPFSYYRTYTTMDPSLARALCDAGQLISNGHLPPKGFNYARFFLIPKKTGGLIQDTRGISVANADNRIVASAGAKAIEDALRNYISPWQKGFVPGREGKDHVTSLVGEFYRCANEGTQRHVLLLDMKRAFDTMSHSFIHACLRQLGFPNWFRRLVGGLLHQVVVIPAFSSDPAHFIRILRGVKQGCPLSPLLFVICFDVFLRRLSTIDGLSLHAFADDLAMAAKLIKTILRGMREARVFGTFSGLQINQVKTVMVSSIKPSHRSRVAFDQLGWDCIKFVAEAVYLGLLFGRDVSTVDIFRPAFDKFNSRLKRIAPVIKSSSLHDRIIIFNVFLLPLFYYLGQFLVIPWFQVAAPVRALCCAHIIPFRGGGFCYAHLVTPRSEGFGPFTPLRDLWSFNMTLLGWDFDLERSHLSAEVDLGTFQKVLTPTGLDNNMVCEAHGAYGAFILLYSYVPRRGKLIDLAALPPMDRPTARRRWVYNAIATEGLWRERRDPRIKTSLTRKLSNLLKTPPLLKEAHHVNAHAMLARKTRTVTPAVWNTQFRLMMHALPFDRRRRKAKMVVKKGGCYFCGKEEDSVRHVFGCQVVNEAREELAKRIGCTLPHGLKYTLLAFPPTTSPISTLAFFHFNWAVWDTRQSYLTTLATVPDKATIVNRVVAKAIHRIRPEGGGAPANEKRLEALANQPPEGAAVGFSDGSSKKNGEGGAGYTVKVPNRDKEEFATPLGKVDNNEAEMEGLQGVLIRLLFLFTLAPFSAALIFSDSAVCLGYLLKGWACPTREALARNVRRLLHKAYTLFTVRLYWVRGHTGLEGNEDADRLAGIAAEGTKLAPPKEPG